MLHILAAVVPMLSSKDRPSPEWLPLREAKSHAPLVSYRARL